jgi:hypothetical protein
MLVPNEQNPDPAILKEMHKEYYQLRSKFNEWLSLELFLVPGAISSWAHGHHLACVQQMIESAGAGKSQKEVQSEPIGYIASAFTFGLWLGEQGVKLEDFTAYMNEKLTVEDERKFLGGNPGSAAGTEV